MPIALLLWLLLPSGPVAPGLTHASPGVSSPGDSSSRVGLAGVKSSVDAARRVWQDTLVIRLVNDTDAERRTKAQLERLVRENEIGRWIETREVVVDETAIPHSHPVLTVHTRHLGDDDALLSTFVHEQFHWYANRAGERTDSAIAAFRERFPDAPVGGGEGAGSAHSTYLHLVVCDLEFQAMTLLRGRERAAEVLSRFNHYRWIYQRVLTDPAIREANTRYGLTIR